MVEEGEDGGDQEECSICDVFRCFCEEIPTTDEKKTECKEKVEKFIKEEIADTELDEYFLTFGKDIASQTIGKCNLKVGKNWGLSEEEIKELSELQKELAQSQ